MATPGRLRLLGTLAIGMLSISLGSIFVKWAHEAPSLTIAFFRMASAALVLSPFYWLRRAASRRQVSQLTGRQILAQLLAGMALAAHFAFWVSSLRFTSVAVSTLLVTTSPVFVVVIAYLVLGERTTRLGLGGILVSFAGASILLGGDLTLRGWQGPVLALAGAVMIALYWVMGRGLRQGKGLLDYVYPVYLIAALVLGLVVWILGLKLWGFSAQTWAAMVLAGVIPQCLGHTAYNWSLAYLPATTVATLSLAEPILASLLAYFLLGEAITALVVSGGALVGTGIMLVSLYGSAD